MESNYQDEVKIQYQTLKEQKKYQEMKQLIDTELSMPYIPSEFERWLLQCREECNSLLPKIKRHIIDDENLEEFLFGSPDKQSVALEYLSERNLRKYTELIGKWFLYDYHDPYVASFLMEAIAGQGMSDTFPVKTRAGIAVFNAGTFIEPTKTEGFETVFQTLTDWFSNKEPNFLKMCVDVLVRESYLRLPNVISVEDAPLVALAVARYVYHAWGRDDEFRMFYEGMCANCWKLIQLEIQMIEKV
ncbi:MAG: hypothetical protein HUJ58_02065 [Erysipelotrichaceae bacterium]|nr:hypothetical protein [Erysipelotrichaceae bacterium]